EPDCRPVWCANGRTTDGRATVRRFSRRLSRRSSTNGRSSSEETGPRLHSKH
ncbi:hypothetical protein M9458_014863, partial [Cirrhinus mrigala]